MDNRHRELHGALLDAQLLADVYLAMSGGQGDLGLLGQAVVRKQEKVTLSSTQRHIPIIRATETELALHQQLLTEIGKASKGVVMFHNVDSINTDTHGEVN